MRVLRHLPNALTCANLLCGSLGIVFVFSDAGIEGGSPMYAAYFVWAACFFDFLDGFAARALGVSSAIGKELDSLADMVSFGVLPAFALYRMIIASEERPHSFFDISLVAFLIVVFSALRLAKFNIDENQKDSFIGVPTPACALFITAIPFLPDPLNSFTSHTGGLVAVAVVFSFLLVSPFELFALKFKNFTWADNKIRFTFILLAVLLLATWQAGAVAPIILLYIAISLVSRVLGRS